MYQIAMLLLTLGAGTTALSGDLTLTLGSSGVSPSAHFQIRDPNGSNRKVLLAALPGTQGNSTGIWYVIRNAGTANTLTVKDSADAITYATLNPGDWVYMIASGATTSSWYVAAGSTGQSSLTLTGAITAVGAALTGPITFKDASSPTKILSFAMSAITGGQTRTLTMADFDVNLNTGPFTENTDVVIPVSTISFTAVADVWTRSRSGAADYKIARNAGASVGVLAVEVPTIVLRSTASKGRKITGLKIKYAIATAAAHDVTAQLSYTVVPATGAAVAAAANLGTVTYDSNHDTSAKRKAVGEHTMQVTFGSPVYAADMVGTEIAITVDAALTTAFSVSQIELLASETLIDAT